MKVSGVVLDALPNAQFMVKLEDGNHIRCYLSGKMNMNHIRVIIGDTVTIEIVPTLEIKNQIGRIVLRK